MLIENKVQIEAIKTRNYMAGKVNDTIMFTDGSFIVYMKERDCLIDISKLKEFPENGLRKYCEDKIESLLRPVRLSNKALILTGGTARLFENRETGERIWINDRYIKMFQGCDFHQVDTGDKSNEIVFTRYGKIVGLVLPIRVSEDFENR